MTRSALVPTQPNAVSTKRAKSASGRGEARSPIRGRAAIQKFLEGFSDFKVLSNSDLPGSTLIDGDTSEQLGTYHQKVRSPEGKLFEVSGRLEIAWVKDASGEWYIAQLETFPGQ